MLEYQSIEYGLHENLVKIEEIFSLLGFEKSLTDSINECKELVETKKYVVAVMGEFKRGKSSLINALLGLRILPVDTTPATAALNRIVYGKSSKVEIHYKDGKVKEIGMDELSDYVTQTTPEGKARALSIKEAVVYAPTVICQNHVEIIDTPGLNDNQAMTKITVDMLNNVDGVVIPIHAKSPFSEVERKFVCQLIKCENIHNLLFVVTFIDQLDEDDYDYDNFMKFLAGRIKNDVLEELTKTKADQKILNRATRMLAGMRIFGVSSELALQSFVSNNKALLKKSRFEEFSNNLLRVITSEQLENVLRRSVAEFYRLQASMKDQNNKRILEFDEQLNSINNFIHLIKDDRTESKAEMEKAIKSGEDWRSRILSECNKLKNILADQFLNGVFSLDGKPPYIANEFINNTAIRAGNLANERIMKEIIPGLIDSFQGDFERFQITRRARLSPAMKTLGIEVIPGEQEFEKKVSELFQARLSNHEFHWVIDNRSVPYQWINRNGTATIPQNWNVNGQVMFEIVLRMVSVSIDSYIQSFSPVFDSILCDLLTFVDEENEILHQSSEERSRQRKEEIQIEIKSYRSNYQILQQKVNKIVEDSQFLLEQYLEQTGSC